MERDLKKDRSDFDKAAHANWVLTQDREPSADDYKAMDFFYGAHLDPLRMNPVTHASGLVGAGVSGGTADKVDNVSAGTGGRSPASDSCVDKQSETTNSEHNKQQGSGNS